MSNPGKIDVALRETIIREWVKALPAERKAICAKHGISSTLPLYWRRQGHFPKDLVVPQEPIPAKTVTAPTAPAAKVEPRDEAKEPYSIEERKIIKREWDAARAAVRAGGGDKRAVNGAGKMIVEKYGAGIHRWVTRSIHSKLFRGTIRRRYPEELKRKVAAAYHAGGGLLAVAKKFGISSPTQVRYWAEAYPADAAPKKGGRPRKAKSAELVGAMNRALDRVNGTYHPPATRKGGQAMTVAGVLAEAFRRLKAAGTIVTKVETDQDGRVVRITTQTTETIEL